MLPRACSWTNCMVARGSKSWHSQGSTTHRVHTPPVDNAIVTRNSASYWYALVDKSSCIEPKWHPLFAYKLVQRDLQVLVCTQSPQQSTRVNWKKRQRWATHNPTVGYSPLDVPLSRNSKGSSKNRHHVLCTWVHLGNSATCDDTYVPCISWKT